MSTTLAALALLLAAEAKITLSVPKVIDGIRCAEVAWVQEDGRLSGCLLADGNVMGDVALPAGSRLGRLRLREGGWWVQFPKPVRFAGITCDGSGVEGPMTSFYPSRKLRSCYLREDAPVANVPCRHGGFWTDVTGGFAHVQFHENGVLARCELSRAWAAGPYRFRTGDTVCFDAAGQPAACARRGCKGPACKGRPVTRALHIIRRHESSCCG